MKTVVAIDGPAASGKSSVSRKVAQRMGYVYLNSGGFYRAITCRMVMDGVDVASAEAVEAAMKGISVTAQVANNEARCLVNGEDLDAHLRDPKVNASVSPVSRVPAVRDALMPLFHETATKQDIVVEGRDIGSVVFPGTPYKFYLDAAPEVRQKRRSSQGEKDEIAARDRSDSTRAAAPLVIAKDATVIDSTHLTLDGVVDEIVGQLKLHGLEVSAG